MNPEDIQVWSAATGSAISTVKEAISLIPSKAKREQITKDIELAEQKIKEAEAIKAKDFGYDLCLRTYPPHIMTMKRIGAQDHWFCPICQVNWDGKTEKEILEDRKSVSPIYHAFSFINDEIHRQSRKVIPGEHGKLDWCFSDPFLLSLVR